MKETNTDIKLSTQKINENEKNEQWRNEGSESWDRDHVSFESKETAYINGFIAARQLSEKEKQETETRLAEVSSSLENLTERYYISQQIKSSLEYILGLYHGKDREIKGLKAQVLSLEMSQENLYKEQVLSRKKESEQIEVKIELKNKIKVLEQRLLKSSKKKD